MERLDAAIRKELSRFGPQGGMAELLEAWPPAVGEMVAANACPARIARDGTLHVNTSSSAWAFELTQLAPTILERLQQKLGGNAPKTIRFAVGHLPEPAAPAEGDRAAEVPEPSQEVLQTAAELTAAIDDEVLRERVARAAALSLSKPSSDSPF